MHHQEPTRKRSESESNAELDLALRKRRSERQGCAGRDNLAARQYCAGPEAVHIKRSITRTAPPCDGAYGPRRVNAKQGVYLVVHAGKIRTVGDVESFRREDHVDPLAEFVLPAQTHVPIIEAGPETRITRRPDGTLIGCVIVTVDFASGE